MYLGLSLSNPKKSGITKRHKKYNKADRINYVHINQWNVYILVYMFNSSMSNKDVNEMVTKPLNVLYPKVFEIVYITMD